MAEKAHLRRDALTADIAILLQGEGVALLPLRDMAAKLGTSDRMLLYYFGTQEALLRATLTHLSGELADRLDAVMPGTQQPPALLLKRLLSLTTDPSVAPILRVWADVVARGGRGEQPFADFARDAVGAWRDRISAWLDVESSSKRKKTAAALLAVIEGARMLEAIMPGATKGAGTILAKAFD